MLRDRPVTEVKVKHNETHFEQALHNRVHPV